MSGGDRSVDDETTEHPVASEWPAPVPPVSDPRVDRPEAWQPPPPHGPTPPPQQTWTPPPQPNWTPPQPQGWAAPQPGWGPPQQPWHTGYGGQPPYWAQPQYRSSPLAVVAAVMLLIFGVLTTLVGLLLLLVGAGAATFIAAVDPIMADEAGAIGAVILTVAAILLIVGLLVIGGAIGIFVHKSWARWIGLVVGSVGVVIGFLLLIGTFASPAGGSGDALIAIIWLASHGFVVAALAVAGDHFQPVYPPS